MFRFLQRMLSYRCVRMFRLLLYIFFIFTTIVTHAATLVSYTGSSVTYTVPNNVYYLLIESFGAQGSSNNNYIGGKGGRVLCIIPVTPSEILSVTVGGNSGFNSWNAGYPNGANGCYSTWDNGNKGGGGGG